MTSTATPPGRAVWLVGAPATGKTTLARAVLARLRGRGVVTLWLDSDDLRRVLTPAPTYDDAERDRLYAAIAHLARLGVEGGATVVISATAHRRAWRDALREQLGHLDEVWVTAPLDVLRARDPKGLYRQVAEHRISRLPGVDVPFEPPLAPALVLDTAASSADDLADAVVAHLDTPGT